MTKDNEIALRAELEHIFDSGANEIRVFNMVKAFIDIREIELNTLPIQNVSNNEVAVCDHYEVRLVRWAVECVKCGKLTKR